MSQPELEFEFDPREFLREDVSPTPPSRKRAIFKRLTLVGLVGVAFISVLSLYGDAGNYIVTLYGTKEDAAHVVDDTRKAIADTKTL